MKNLLFLLTAFIVTMNVYAQKKDIPLSSTTENLLMFDEPVEHPFGEYSEKICEKLSTVAKNLVKYETSALVYIRFSKSNMLDNASVTVKATDKVLTSAKIEDSELIIPNLPLSTTLKLFYLNGCNEETFLTSFNTSIAEEDKDEFEVSRLLFNEYSNYISSDLAKDMDIIQFFEENNVIPYYEKLGFFQAYILNGKPIEDELRYGRISKWQIPLKWATECNCDLLKAETYFSHGIKNNTDNSNPDVIDGNSGYLSSQNFMQDGSWSSNSGYQRNLYSKGAAKHQDVYVHGKRTNSHTVELRTSGVPITPIGDVLSNDDLPSTHLVEIRINNICRDGAFISDACGCDRVVSYKANYLTRLRTSVSTPSCWLCGTKKTKAKAEDIVAITLANSEGFFQVLDAGRATVTSEKSVSYDEFFYISVLDFATDIALLFTKDYGTSFDSISVNTISNNIETLITTPYADVGGGGSDKDAHIRLIDKNGTFTIKSNTPWSFSMYSSSLTTVYGTRSWNSAARIVSDFGFEAGVLSGGYVGQADHCCANGLSSWALATFPESSTLTANYISEIDGFFFLNGLNFNDQEYGAMKTDINCENGGLETNNNQVEIDLDAEVNYSLFNINGALILTGNDKVSEFNSLMHDSSINIPNGMYILTYEINGEIYTKKLVK